MANALYPKWKEALLQNLADCDLDGSGTTGVYAALVDTGVYTYDAADQYWDESGANDPIDGLIGTAIEIGATKTYTNGVFDGADVTIPTVSGNSAEAIVIFRKNTGAATTWRLVAYIDTSVTGLPVTPNGGDISIQWHSSGIFSL